MALVVVLFSFSAFFLNWGAVVSNNVVYTDSEASFRSRMKKKTEITQEIEFGPSSFNDCPSEQIDAQQPYFDIVERNGNDNDKNMSSRRRRQSVTCRNIIIANKLHWCPVAKVGTTAIYSILKNALPGFEKAMRPRCYSDCSLLAWRFLSGNATQRELVANATSFMVVRNPWDRMRSGYMGKIITNAIPVYKGRTNKIIPDPSFLDFVRYVEKYPLRNIHWKPFTELCQPTPDEHGRVFHYDHVIRLEDGLFRGFARVLEHAGMELLPKRHGMEGELAADNFSITGKGGKVMRDKPAYSYNSMVEFYREAASAGNVTMKQLIDRVYRIYRKDVDNWEYSFPSY